MKKIIFSLFILILLSSCGKGLEALNTGASRQASVEAGGSTELFKIKNIRINGSTHRTEFSIYNLNTPQSL